MAKPEKKFRCGAVEAAVFENRVQKDGQTLRLKKVSVHKRYLDADGNWESTNSYDIGDLPKLKLVADEAYRHLALGRDDRNSDLPESGKGE